jgi:hypothetical protein
MRFSEILIFNFIKDQKPEFSYYSKASQETIVKKIFEQVLLQRISKEGDLKSFIDNVVLNQSGKTSVNLPSDDPAEAALIAMLLADPDWKQKIPDRKDLLPLILSIFWEKDPKMFQIARNWLQAKLEAAKEEIPCARMRSIYIRNLLAYYPFFSPERGDKIRLPLGEEGKLIEYEVVPIELTPSFWVTPLMAYGLQSTEGPSFLLFKGTTYPTDEGYLQSLLTDINPFACVGSYAFQFFAKKRIEKWLVDHEKAEVIGASLGGSLSLQTVSYFPEKVKAVHAFNSPGMSSSEIKVWKQKTEKLNLEERPDVNVYLQSKDLISSFVGSCFALDWNIHHVYAPIEDSLQAHAAAYTAHEEAFIIPGDANSVNRSLKRRIWPIVQNILFVPFFFIGAICFLVVACALAISHFVQKHLLLSKKKQLV